MAPSSMTGFARSHGVSGSYAWAWEVKSVNGKGLDLRLRLPPGWDSIEAPVRARAAQRLARGSIQAILTVERSGVTPVVRINAAVLDAILTTVRQLAPRIEAAPPSLDGLLSLKGVMEVSDFEENEEERRNAETAAIAGFADAAGALSEMRQREGAALARILKSRLDEIGALAQRAEHTPGRRVEAIRARLAVRWLRCSPSPNGSIPIGCIRKRSCWRPRLTCVKSSIVLPRMSRRRSSSLIRAAQWGADSISWRRSSIVKPIRCALRPTTSSSPISGWS